MEHSIYFNNDSANENILATLEELDNIFFIENSSSNSKKSVSNSEIISNSDNIDDAKENFIDNFNEMHLSNFEFVENSDNFIKDEVYDNLKLKVREIFNNNKCLYNFNCFEKIGYEQFFIHYIEFEGLNKNMRDIVIKGQLIAFQQDENTKKKNCQ